MASSSLAIDNSDYDVFLSFRGTDTRNNFTSHLYDALCRENIKAFIDERLDRGEEITPAILKIIEATKICVIVFSSDYASSMFCLDEAVKILECRESNEHIVLPIFYKVDPAEVAEQRGSYGKAFVRHENKGKETCGEEVCEQEMEKVQKWKSALSKAASLTGWHMKHDSNEADYIRRVVGEILKILDSGLTHQSKGEELICIPLAGQSTTTTNIENIWKCLTHDNTSRIGVYGMGGVGKTTIIAHINNALIKDANSFVRVYWVTVRKESSIYKLQSDIAKVINFDLPREEDELKRAAKLREALLRRKKFVLILDDVWEAFEIEKVGIPIAVDGGKLLLTTRNRRVCLKMQCEPVIKVEPLSKREGWHLFIKESGFQLNTSSELREHVESVVKECAGLPLAIVTVARSMRGVVEISEWRNILRKLKKPFEGQNHELEEDVFKPLKVSYDRLRDEIHQQCLLYCSLYPEDHIIPRSALIGYWIGEGLIDELDSRQAEFDKGVSIINELIDASLLEHHKKDYVKMHDVVRDMALIITRENFMVKAGLHLHDFPKVTEWSVNLQRVSLMCNYKLKRCGSHLAPKCSDLRTLLMQANMNLRELPSCFFVNMGNLTVLDMSDLKCLRFLPDSIANLKNLRMLILGECSLLEHIPSLAGLESLRHLDLHGTNIKELPEGLEKLVNLRELNLMHTKALCGLIPSAVLTKLSHLQCLKLEGSNAEVEPNSLISLKRLETLSVHFNKIDTLNSYLRSRHWRRLEEYYIFREQRFDIYRYPSPPHDDPYKKIMCLYQIRNWESGACKEKTDILIPDDVHYLEFVNWDSSMGGVLRNRTFVNLQKLVFNKCRVVYLITVAFVQQLLHNIKVLEVVECRYLDEIIGREEEYPHQSNHNNYPSIEMPKLMWLRLDVLPRLRSIYRGRMVCPSLETIEIYSCRKLKRLSLCMQEDDKENPRMIVPSLKKIKGSAESVFQPLLDKIEYCFSSSDSEAELEAEVESESESYGEAEVESESESESEAEPESEVEFATKRSYSISFRSRFRSFFSLF